MHAMAHRLARWVSVLALVATLLALTLAPAAGAPQPAYTYDGPLENVVLDWNLHAVDALINAPTAATPGVGPNRRRSRACTSRWCRARSTTRST